MIGFIKKYKEITLIGLSVLGIYLYNTGKTDFTVNEKTKLEIMEKSKIIQSKEMILKELETKLKLMVFKKTNHLLWMLIH